MIILFNRWMISRVDRAVRRAESGPFCNGWIMTDQDAGHRCMRPVGHDGFCDTTPSIRTNVRPPTQAEQARNYEAKSYAFGVGPKPSNECLVTPFQTSGTWYCTRPRGHDGPCAMLPTMGAH